MFMNEMKSTKKGSGITENENLCHKCYENVLKIYWLIIVPLLEEKQNVIVVTSNWNITDKEEHSKSSQHVH